MENNEMKYNEVDEQIKIRENHIDKKKQKTTIQNEKTIKNNEIKNNKKQ
jgi:hypothetical protein